MLRQKSWIEQANEIVKISDVLTSIGVYVPDTIRNGGNKKIFCPFGFYHSDGGTTKAMKIYTASNSAYCFSCGKRYEPVTLAAAIWDISWVNAAFRLLEDAGFKPKSLEERWQDATTKLENKPDLIALADALKMYCSAICPTWQTQQLDDIVAMKLSKCLDLLNAVDSDEDAVKWLATTKIVMSNLLEDRSD
jgi:hypothetical protein